MLVKEYIIAKASEYYTKYDNSYECSTSVPAVISRKEVLLVETSVFDVRVAILNGTPLGSTLKVR